MEIHTHHRDGTLIARPAGPRIDAAAAIRFKDAMREILRESPLPLIIDLHRVVFVDSSGLGAIVAVMKMVGPDRRFALAGLTPAVARVFQLTRMDTMITILPALADGDNADRD